VRTLLTALALVALAWPAPPSSADETANPRLRVVGSTTVARLLERWSGALAQGSPPLSLDVVSSGSSSAPHALLTGRADVVSMSRPMKPIELSAFRQHHHGDPVAIGVATDAIAVFVHESNPIEGISISELDRVFALEPGCSDGPPIRNWSELGVGGAFAGRAISRFGRPAGSGTREVFERIALCGARTDPKVRQRPGPRSVALSVAESRFAISYGSAADAVDGVRMIPVSPGTGESAVALDHEAVAEGRYPLSRTLWLYARAGEADPRWVQLVRFALSDAGQAAAEAEGYWRISEGRRTRGLAAVGR
jgi:phosphate transport system substrate-binding protein